MIVLTTVHDTEASGAAGRLLLIVTRGEGIKEGSGKEARTGHPAPLAEPASHL